jgi:hypothetical protein
MSTRYFLAISLTAVLAIIGYRYYQYVIERDFIVVANVSCDPAAESCFVADCDPEDSECDASPYKKIELVSAEAPHCIEEHTCEDFSCTSDSCSVTECSEDTVEEGETCLLPEPAIEPEPTADADTQGDEIDEIDETGEAGDTGSAPSEQGSGSASSQPL